MPFTFWPTESTSNNALSTMGRLCLYSYQPSMHEWAVVCIVPTRGYHDSAMGITNDPRTDESNLCKRILMGGGGNVHLACRISRWRLSSIHSRWTGLKYLHQNQSNSIFSLGNISAFNVFLVKSWKYRSNWRSDWFSWRSGCTCFFAPQWKNV